MSVKIITEKDFWTCSEGAMPAPLQGTRKSLKKKSGYILPYQIRQQQAG